MGAGPSSSRLREQQRDQRCLDDQQLSELVALSGRVQRHFGCHQDIEWAIAHAGEWPDGVSVMQSRPVTTLAKRRPAPPQSAMSLVMSTFGVRPPEREEES